MLELIINLSWWYCCYWLAYS